MTEFETFLKAVEHDDLEAVRTSLDQNQDLVKQRDASGATALHFAALYGRRRIARLLVERGADVNARGGEFHATPAGWAIEYLRELGGFLGIELADLTYAIETRDVKWAKRFLARFPAMRDGVGRDGVTFRELAASLGDPEIVALFGDEAVGVES